MRIRNLLALLALAVITVFFVINWRVFTTPANISFVVTSVDMPVGVATLALSALALLVFLGYVGFWQSTILAEFRRQSRELETQRTLAENAEASRFTELGKLVRDELAKSDSRLEAALDCLRKDLKDTENSIAATLGELDDRISRGAASSPR
jgi:hypothetical protein